MKVLLKELLKKVMASFFLALIIATGFTSLAQEGANESTQGKGKIVTKKKSTDVSFDEVLVEGKYHFADEAVTTVESDKVIDALLNVRTDFKDRIKKSNSRH
jgi:hypothetical protein